MPLGKRVKALRESLGMTLEQLAVRSGVDLGTIGALEVRDSSRSKYAAELAAGLGVSLDDLLGKTEIPKVRPTRSQSREWPFAPELLERILALPPDGRAEAEGDLRYSVDKIERRSSKKSKHATGRAA